MWSVVSLCICSLFLFVILLCFGIIIIVVVVDSIKHFCWETFTYSRVSVGLGSVRERRFTLSSKVKGRALGICILYDTFVMVLLFASLLRCFWLNLFSLDVLGIFC